ncbi:MAG TPA: histidine phosphatase family protein [Polyangiales bacterium]
MPLLLVRHAEAVAERAGLDDSARWLTKAGRAQARDVAERVRDQGLMPTRIVASPRVRTVQTAELFAQVLGFRSTVEIVPSLSYTVPAEQAARDLSAYPEDELVAAFGHMPTIAEIAARLTAQRHRDGFSPAQAVMIEDGRVVWSASPR